MDTANAQQIIDSYLSALVAGDLEGVLALYADGATVEDPVGSPLIAGSEALAAFYQVAVDKVTAARTLGPVRCAGNEFAVPFEIEADFGAKVAIEIIDVFTLNETGKITSMRAFWSQDNTRQL